MHQCSIGFVMWSVRSWFKTGKAWNGRHGNGGLRIMTYHVVEYADIRRSSVTGSQKGCTQKQKPKEKRSISLQEKNEKCDYSPSEKIFFLRHCIKAFIMGGFLTSPTFDCTPGYVPLVKSTHSLQILLSRIRYRPTSYQSRTRLFPSPTLVEQTIKMTKWTLFWLVSGKWSNLLWKFYKKKMIDFLLFHFL